MNHAVFFRYAVKAPGFSQLVKTKEPLQMSLTFVFGLYERSILFTSELLLKSHNFRQNIHDVGNLNQIPFVSPTRKHLNEVRLVKNILKQTAAGPQSGQTWCIMGCISCG